MKSLIRTAVFSILVSSAFAAGAQTIDASQSASQATQAVVVASNDGAASPLAHHRLAWLKHHSDRRSSDRNACVGPTSFCNLYFGG